LETAPPRPFPIRHGRTAWLWATVPLWLLAFAAARLLEYAPFASLWFPPTAVSFAALVLFGRRGWWPVGLAALLGHAYTLHRLDIAWTVESVAIAGLGFALAHTLPLALLASALQRVSKRDTMGRFGPSTLFVLIAGGGAACSASALGGSAALVAGGIAEGIDLRWSVVPWLIGDYTGLLALGPLLVEAMRQRLAPDAASAVSPPWPKLATLIGLIAATMVAAAFWPDDDAIIFTVFFALVVQQWISHTQPPLQALCALALAAITIAVLVPVLGLGHHALKLQFALIALSLTCYSALSFLGLRDDNRRLKALLSTDALTATASRAHFATLTGRAMAASIASGAPLSLMMLDLDHLKRINDAFGHGAGDEALRRFAAICREHLRADDALGRLGGDEFAVCLPGLDAASAGRRGDALLAALGAASTDALPLAASIGVAQLRAGDTYAALVQRADDALMTAKREGRGRRVTAAAT
jgi:diguanylate cyclase (GGDEF)-like protein